MKLLKNFTVSYTLLLILTSCQTPQISLPPVEDCTILYSGVICTDDRTEEIPEGCVADGEDYICDLEYSAGYKCTNPDDYIKLYNEYVDTKIKLYKCERRCNNK